MRRILLIIGSILVVAIASLAVVVAMQPAEFSVSRSAVITAPPEKVFSYVNDLQKWNDWSPWAKLDPNAKNTFEGPESGEGAVFRWSGNDQIGEGEMTITESRPNELVRMRLHFVKPMEDTETTVFLFKPDGEDKTDVTWTMTGKNNFIGKAFCLFMDMDKMVGGSFEEGLANLEQAVQPAKSE